MERQVITDIEAIRGYIHTQDKKLINQALNGLDIAKDLTVINNLREPRDLNKMIVDKGVRPHNLAIKTAKGGRKWTKRVITPRLAMKIIEMVPEEVRESFQSSMLDPNAKVLPFAQWVWQQEFAKITSEINDNIYYSVFHNNPEVLDVAETYAIGDLVYFNEIVYKAVAATLAGETPATHPAKWTDADNQVLVEGFDALFEEDILTGDLDVAGSGGTYDHLTAYDAFMDVWSVIPEVVKNQKMITYCSFDAAQDLAADLNKRFGSGMGIGNADIEEGVTFKLKNTGGRNTIKPVTWMGSSKRIITTLNGNLLLGVNQISDKNKVGKIVENLHGFEAIVKFILACQFRDSEVLFINDQK